MPEPFTGWFEARQWSPRPHQMELLQKAQEGRSALLIAPTGAGKTLAGFLPSLVALHHQNGRRNSSARDGPHTLYVSPLKALAVDIARNLEAPIRDMNLNITVETRTGDTPQNRRRRQKESPPDILLTTSEQVALLISQPDAARFFSQLEAVIIDELHAIVTSKRGDLLALGLARLRSHAPQLRAVGLSATVADPAALSAWLVPQNGNQNAAADVIAVKGGAKPDVSIVKSEARVPWSGHMTRWALDDIYSLIKSHGTSLVFV
ncbi:MAG: DEAD/DEAH box helicase, partial [Pseudomonadota bacterium]